MTYYDKSGSGFDASVFVPNKGGRKRGQRNPNSVARDAAIARGKQLIANGMDIVKAAEVIEPEYYQDRMTDVQWPERRFKYVVSLLKAD
ncbi:MAG: hypothetical protein ABI810_15805 [Sphingomonas bacterium]